MHHKSSSDAGDLLLPFAMFHIELFRIKHAALKILRAAFPEHT